MAAPHSIRPTLKFDDATISDQKRLVRGELLLQVRHCLRARDHTHNAKWRILTLAGGAPAGELTAIRECFPKAFVVAVDKDARCLEAAITAGADDIIHCDLCDWSEWHTPAGTPKPGPAKAISDAGPFDLLCLDLCAGPNPTTKQIFSIYRKVLAKNGLLLATFSYGRDVAEVFHDVLEREFWGAKRLAESGVPKTLAGRLLYLFDSNQTCRIMAIMAYRGAEMPMCSVLLNYAHTYRKDFSFTQVEAADFEIAVCYPESAKLYDCPQERIEAFRRRHSALKAVATRRQLALLP